MVMSLDFANSSVLLGVSIFIGAWNLECRYQSLRPSYNPQAHFMAWYFINVCFNCTVLLPYESGKGQGFLLVSFSSSCLEEKKVNPGHIKTSLPWHKFIAFRCLWLLGLSGEAEPLMVISEWQAFLLWVCLCGTCLHLYICMSCGSEFPSLCVAWKFTAFPFL